MTGNDVDDLLDLVPFGNRVIIKKYIVEKTKGGIIMPDKDSILLSEGRVIAKGPSAQRVDIGDLVLFGKNVATDIERNGEIFSIMYESSIEARIDKSKSSKDSFIKKEI